MLVAIFTLGVSCGVLLHAEGHGSEHIGVCCLVISARYVTCLFPLVPCTGHVLPFSAFEVM